ncbi:hypothetical protein CW752_06545 [Chryseobacterium sp. PMSZPI]|nr:hypothetical protein CW752_06545 [Chryseobacterium sp. PMSZPI]
MNVLKNVIKIYELNFILKIVILNDLGNWNVKKMKSVNVKKTLLSECGTKTDSKLLLNPHEF